VIFLFALLGFDYVINLFKNKELQKDKEARKK